MKAYSWKGITGDLTQPLFLFYNSIYIFLLLKLIQSLCIAIWYSMLFQQMCTVCYDQTRVIGLSIKQLTFPCQPLSFIDKEIEQKLRRPPLHSTLLPEPLWCTYTTFYERRNTAVRVARRKEFRCNLTKTKVMKCTFTKIIYSGFKNSFSNKRLWMNFIQYWYIL